MKTNTQPGKFGMRCLMAALMLALSAMTAQAQSAAPRNSVPKTAPAATPVAKKVPEAAGEPLDRVVAIVNGDLILDSDVDQEVRFQSLQPFRSANSSTRSEIIERLINRQLILQQAKLQPGDAVSDADLNKELDALRKNSPACKMRDCTSEAGWTSFLDAHGFTPASFMEMWRQRMEVLRFIEQRFRMGVRITPEEISTYYTKTMLPEYAKQKATPPKLEVISDRIQEVLLEQRVSSLLSDWLNSLKAQGSVVVMHPGQEAP